MASKFLVNIDEFFGAKKSSNAQLKAMVSQKTAAIWVPFKNRIEQLPRITSFFSTGNLTKKAILSKDSSNSRYLIYNIKKIDWNYKNEVDPSILWQYAISKANDPAYVSELPIDDVRKIEKYNKLFSKPRSTDKRQSLSSRGVTTVATTIALTAFAFTPWGRALLASVMSLVRSLVGTT